MYKIVTDDKMYPRTAVIPFLALPKNDAKYVKLNNKVIVKVIPDFTGENDTIRLHPETAKLVGSNIISMETVNVPEAHKARITVTTNKHITEEEVFKNIAEIPLINNEEIEFPGFTIRVSSTDEVFIIGPDTQLEIQFIFLSTNEIFNDIIDQIRKMLDFDMECPKGVLLHGERGSGKTTILKTISTLYPSIVVQAGNILSNGKPLQYMQKIISEATKNNQIIIIDDLDIILSHCPRLVGVLLTAFDDQNTPKMIASTKNIYSINESLISSCKFGFDIRTRPPTIEEIKKLFSNIEMNDDVAQTLHGYVIADVIRFVSYALLEHGKVDNETITEIMKKYPPYTLSKYKIEMSEKLSWEDVGGLENVKKDLQKAIEWPLKYPDLFEKMKTTPPRGILLYGPPGTGKTLLAKVVASETGATFIAVKSPDLLDKYVGTTESRIREIFDKARKHSPSIIFFDEIDAIAPRRGNNTTKAIDSIINQLLSELDGIRDNKQIVVIATTNRPDIIDPALLRPGRLEKLIHVPIPDDNARREIFEIKLRGKPVKGVININELVKLSNGLTGADIDAVVREASYYAIERAIETGEEPAVTQDDLVWAIDRILSMKRNGGGDI